VVPPAQAADAIQLVYPAGRLSGYGWVVPDPLATAGEARLGERAGADLLFGPYETLPRGGYRVAFRARLARPLADSSPAGAVAVTASRGRVLLAARDIRADELATGEYRDVVLEVRLPATTPDLEWRLRPTVPETVLADRVVVVPLNLRVRARAMP